MTEHDGCMVAFFMPDDVAAKLALEGGEPQEELHLTLAFIPEVPDQDKIGQIHSLLTEMSQQRSALAAQISGLGLFTAGEEPITYASVDAPELPDFRQQLVRRLKESGIEISEDHGYTPHVTLAYEDHRDLDIPVIDFELDTLSFAIGPDRTNFPMTGRAETAQPNDENQLISSGKISIKTTNHAETLAVTIDDLRAAVRSAAATPPNSPERINVMRAAQAAGMLHLVPDSWRASALTTYLDSYTETTTASATKTAPNPATVAKVVSAATDSAQAVKASLASYATTPRHQKASLRREIIERATTLGMTNLLPTAWRVSVPTTNLEEALAVRASAFNAKHPDIAVSVARLRTVYLRGVSEHRQEALVAAGKNEPLPMSSTQWGLARVNSFLRLAAGDPSARTSDADLLPQPAAQFKDYSAAQRKKAESDGAAMKGGKFPIRDEADLKNAIRAYGRAKDSEKPAVKKHIMTRAKSLGKTSLIPDSWKDSSRA